MTSRDFCYWLQGFFEIASVNVENLNETQVKQIRAHLALVFRHEIDPSFKDEGRQGVHDSAPNQTYCGDIPITC